jgi:hypothetical protein
MKNFSLIILFFLVFLLPATSQEAYRFHSDFLFRAKGVDSLFHITKGEVFYDKNIKKLVFKNTFPKKETYLINDTTLYVFHSDTFIESRKNIIPPEHTMFNYLLSSSFSNYGMNGSGFEVGNIEKKKDIVVTSWVPKGVIGKYIGKILIANKDKRLHSVVIFDKDLKMMNRQIFKKYQNINGSEIPSEILSVSYYSDSSTYIQITNLNNITLNESDNQDIYDFKIPTQ